MTSGCANRQLPDELNCLTVHDLTTLKGYSSKKNFGKRLSTPDLDIDYCSLPTNWISQNELSLPKLPNNDTASTSVYTKIIPHVTNHISEESHENLNKLRYQIDIRDAKWALDTALELGVGAGGSVALTSSKAILGKRKQYSRNLSSHIAVKRFTPKETFETDGEYYKRHATELYLACMVDHKNIIYSNCAFLYQNSFHLAMEYCPTDFFKLIATGSLSTNEIDDYFIQMISGLRYLHSCGIAHRDLKIENFMVTEDNTLKIIDFGFATTERPSIGLWGSDPYMAPEIFSRESYDPELADVWSLAIIYFSCIQSRFPWDIATDQDSLYAQFQVDPTSTSELLPTASRSTILRMLSIDPKSRPNIIDIWSEPWIIKTLEQHNKMKLQL